MIKEVNQACEKLNNTLGISVELPNPKKKALKTAAACNFIIGAGLAAAGIAFTSKSCAGAWNMNDSYSVVYSPEAMDDLREIYLTLLSCVFRNG